MLDTLDPARDNIPAVWEQFLHKFAEQYQDTQREGRACTKLGQLRMKNGEIDEYIAQFEELARQANYTVGRSEVTQYFLEGLTPKALVDVMKPPMATTYEEIKQRAIESARSQQLIDSILGQRGKPNHANTFKSQTQEPCYPFFWRERQNQGNPQRPQFNSLNAPRYMNDSAVPMDIGRTKYRSRGGGPMRGRQAATDNPPRIRGPCFNCEEEGHFAWNCPRKGQNRVNLIDLEEDPYEEMPQQDRVAAIKAGLAAMTIKEKEQLANEMGVGKDEDFPTV
jgi:Retrotransposon gag protein/Zinc knuckle